MTLFLLITVALGCVAWIGAEAKIRRLETKLNRVQAKSRRQRAADFARSRPGFRYASEGVITRLLRDIDHIGRLELVDDGEDAA